MRQYTISVHDVPLEIYRFRYEPVDSNMWFIPVGKRGFVFDPNISEELLPLFKKLGTTNVQIVLTHEHYDHTTGVEWLQSQIEAKVFCQEDCSKYISSGKGNSPRLVAMALKTKDLVDGGHRCDDFMAAYKPYTLKADETFGEKGKVTIDDVSFDSYSTPGHSPGSACYILDNKFVFTGDSLIQNTPTILRFRTSNKESYERVTLPFLKSLDKNMLVFPGHGEPFKINEAKYL